MVDSRILALGERRTMGLFEVCWLRSFLGFIMGITLTFFHALGMMFEFMTLLKRFVMMETEWYERCLT